jgi:glycosyltransferase involved in cell wall biosynthesis
MIIFQEHLGREGTRLKQWERLYRWALGSLADGIIANTDAAFKEITYTLRVNRRRIFRATLLVPPEREVHIQSAISVLPPKHRPLFLFVGQLIDRKNVIGLIEATRSLHSAGHEFEVWIVGDGYRRSALEEQANDLIANGVIRFLGPQPPSAIGWMYEAADVFVMPTLRDYRSVAVLEALRFGLPVIDSRRDGNADDLVLHERTGLLIDPNQPGELAAAMERTIRDPAIVQRLGRNALRLMSNYTSTSAAEALARIVQTIRAR